jgi:hypothetical protein
VDLDGQRHARSRQVNQASGALNERTPGVFSNREDTMTDTVRPSRKRPKSRFLRELGIVGWDHLEPVILASLATESPLLLIGRHGCAKTLVLTRLAEALGIALRHYNASLLNFDDLIGFPVPEDGKLVYLQTPSTIWDAEAVFFDEVSRCRPDLQNKLFPIVHERRVQGLALDGLRHRWAAMNPPPSAEGKAGEADYAGAEPLDVALADRFAFIADVPSLAELSPSDQLSTFCQRSVAGSGRGWRTARRDAAGDPRRAPGGPRRDSVRRGRVRAVRGGKAG